MTSPTRTPGESGKGTRVAAAGGEITSRVSGGVCAAAGATSKVRRVAAATINVVSDRLMRRTDMAGLSRNVTVFRAGRPSITDLVRVRKVVAALPNYNSSHVGLGSNSAVRAG